MRLLFVLLLTCTVVSGYGPFYLHIDAEPNSIWKENTIQVVAQQYVNLLEKVSKSKGLLSVCWYIANVFHEVNVTRGGVTKPLYQWAIDYSDKPVLMMYRNTIDDEDGMQVRIDPDLGYAREINKKVLVAVEVTKPVDDPPKVSFYGHNTTYLENSLVYLKIRNAYDPAFGGVAVHQSDSYAELEQTTKPYECTEKGLFVWNISVATSELARNNFVQFAKAHCVVAVYLDSQYFLDKDPNSLYAFHKKLMENHIQLELLLGYHPWVLEENHNELLNLVEKAVNFASLDQAPESPRSDTCLNTSTASLYQNSFLLCIVIYAYLTLFYLM